MKRLLQYGFHFFVQRAPVAASRLLYFWTFRRPLRLKNPQTINEKLMWLKLYEQEPLKSRCADKLAVRHYVRTCGYAHLLVELLDVYDVAEAIDFERLPDRFVLKCTHGSSFNLFCLDKKTFEPQEARVTLAKWQQQNYSMKRAEMHYAAITPRIVAEGLLAHDDSAPFDYHIHCFHGKPQLIEVRFGEDYVLVDTHGVLQPLNAATAHFDGQFDKPQVWAEMLEVAAGLSASFTYVRVDLYHTQGRVYFSELTFTPDACLDTDYVEGAAYQVGQYLDLTALMNEHTAPSYTLAIKRK